MKKLMLLVVVAMLAGCGDGGVLVSDTAPTVLSDISLPRQQFEVGEDSTRQTLNFKFVDPHNDLVSFTQTIYRPDGAISTTQTFTISPTWPSPLISGIDADTRVAGTYRIEIYTIDSRGNVSNKLHAEYLVVPPVPK